MTDLKIEWKHLNPKRALALFMAMCLCFSTLGFNVSAANLDGEEITKISIADSEGLKEKDLAQGGSIQLTAKVSYKTTTEGTPKTLDEGNITQLEGNTKIIWKSSDTTVATVSDGYILAQNKAGTAKITAEIIVNNETVKSNEFAVKVAEKTAQVISVKVKPDTLPMKTTDEAKQLEVEVTWKTDAEGNEVVGDTAVTWKTSKPAVAEVSEDGKVTAKGVGEAEITATVAGMESSNKCKVTVEKAEDGGEQPVLNGIRVKPTGVKLEEKESSAAIEVEFDWKTTYEGIKNVEKDLNVDWTVKDDKTATVKDGVITGEKAGETTVTASVTFDNEVHKADVKVEVTAKVEEKPAEVKVTGVTLDKTTATLTVDDSLKLNATVAPNNATNKELTWTSGNDKIVTVDQNGNVKAVKDGVVTVKVTSKADATKSASCQITVKKKVVSVTGVTLNATKLTIVKGKTKTLEATVAPTNADNKNVTFKSSNDKIATVNQMGTVKAVKAGTAKITVTTEDGKKTATCTITVPEVKLNATSFPLQVKKSTTALKVVSKFPTNDTVKSWKSNKPKVAKVTSKGKITGVKAGKATITVTMKSGATAKATVTVQKGAVKTKSLKFASKTLTLKKGKSATVAATRNPISATEKITYTTSNGKVATVTKAGKVTAKGMGKATITAKSANKKTAKYTVTVPGITLKATKATIKVKGKYTIKTSKLFPAKDKLTYKSSNAKVAKVSTKGVVTGVKKGTATITVTTKSGVSTKLKVTVKK